MIKPLFTEKKTTRCTEFKMGTCRGEYNIYNSIEVYYIINDSSNDDIYLAVEKLTRMARTLKKPLKIMDIVDPDIRTKLISGYDFRKSYLTDSIIYNR